MMSLFGLFQQAVSNTLYKKGVKLRFAILFQTCLPSTYDGLCSISDLEFVEDVGDMVPNGFWTQHQASSNFCVVTSLCDENQYLPFSLGQFGKGLRKRRVAKGGEVMRQAARNGRTEDGLACSHDAQGSHDLGLIGSFE